MSILAKIVLLFSILVIIFINFFLYILNENFLISLLVLDITLCLYSYTSYTYYMTSMTPIPLFLLNIVVILYIGYMGYITWLDEYDPQTLVTHSNLYWIYLPTIYVGLFMMVFVWKISNLQTKNEEDDFIKGRQRVASSSSQTKPTKPTKPSNKSLLADFDKQIQSPSN